MVIVLHRTMLVTLRVLYFIPRTHLLNEFTWQTDDRVPDMPRVQRFLCHWKDNIGAVIADVEVAVGREANWRRVNHLDGHR